MQANQGFCRGFYIFLALFCLMAVAAWLTPVDTPKAMVMLGRLGVLSLFTAIGFQLVAEYENFLQRRLVPRVLS